VAVTWGLMSFLVGGAFLATRRLSLDPSPTQTAFELIVDTVDGQIRDTMQVEPARYRACIGTLFVFIFVANWSTLIPGVEPPTAHLETDIALAFLVFLAVVFFGIRAGGLRHYLATFASPSPIMIPLNFVESLTRTFSMFDEGIVARLVYLEQQRMKVRRERRCHVRHRGRVPRVKSN
jgi:F-type H+-transporting ATPase subunit a